MLTIYRLLAPLMNVVSPRACAMCGCRLSLTERFICGPCVFQLPLTGFTDDFVHNEVMERFLGVVPVERAFSLVRFTPHAPAARAVYRMKYHHNPLVAEDMGAFVAQELASTAFFDGIDAMVPVPLTPGRERERGYNQSLHLARGMAAVNGLPIITGALVRVRFNGSQTAVSLRERSENVRQAFALAGDRPLRGKHILLVDDVITTGATMTACAEELLKVEGLKLSVLSWGLAGG